MIVNTVCRLASDGRHAAARGWRVQGSRHPADSFRHWHGRNRLRCNAVAPGAVLTPAPLDNLSEDVVTDIRRRNEVGMSGRSNPPEPEDDTSFELLDHAKVGSQQE